MVDLTIDLEQCKTAYRPGEVIAGTARWQSDEPLKHLALRLLWYTQGKGDEDAGLVEEQENEQPDLSDSRVFHFTLPNGPYSFSGTLISLTWAIELIAQPGDHCHRQEITVTPTSQEIILKPVPKADDKDVLKVRFSGGRS